MPHTEVLLCRTLSPTPPSFRAEETVRFVSGLLAADHRGGRSTAYRYRHKGIDALAAAPPGLRGALLAARAAGHPQ